MNLVTTPTSKQVCALRLNATSKLVASTSPRGVAQCSSPMHLIDAVKLAAVAAVAVVATKPSERQSVEPNEGPDLASGEEEPPRWSRSGPNEERPQQGDPPDGLVVCGMSPSAHSMQQQPGRCPTLNHRLQQEQLRPATGSPANKRGHKAHYGDDLSAQTTCPHNAAVSSRRLAPGAVGRQRSPVIARRHSACLVDHEAADRTEARGHCATSPCRGFSVLCSKSGPRRQWDDSRGRCGNGQSNSAPATPNPSAIVAGHTIGRHNEIGGGDNDDNNEHDRTSCLVDPVNSRLAVNTNGLDPVAINSEAPKESANCNRLTALPLWAGHLSIGWPISSDHQEELQPRRCRSLSLSGRRSNGGNLDRFASLAKQWPELPAGGAAPRMGRRESSLMCEAFERSMSNSVERNHLDENNDTQGQPQQPNAHKARDGTRPSCIHLESLTTPPHPLDSFDREPPRERPLVVRMGSNELAEQQSGEPKSAADGEYCSYASGGCQQLTSLSAEFVGGVTWPQSKSREEQQQQQIAQDQDHHRRQNNEPVCTSESNQYFRPSSDATSGRVQSSARGHVESPLQQSYIELQHHRRWSYASVEQDDYGLVHGQIAQARAECGRQTIEYTPVENELDVRPYQIQYADPTLDYLDQHHHYHHHHHHLHPSAHLAAYQTCGTDPGVQSQQSARTHNHELFSRGEPIAFEAHGPTGGHHQLGAPIRMAAAAAATAAIGADETNKTYHLLDSACSGAGGPLSHHCRDGSMLTVAQHYELPSPDYYQIQQPTIAQDHAQQCHLIEPNFSPFNYDQQIVSDQYDPSVEFSSCLQQFEQMTDQDHCEGAETIERDEAGSILDECFGANCASMTQTAGWSQQDQVNCYGEQQMINLDEHKKQTQEARQQAPAGSTAAGRNRAIGHGCGAPPRAAGCKSETLRVLREFIVNRMRLRPGTSLADQSTLRPIDPTANQSHGQVARGAAQTPLSYARQTELASRPSASSSGRQPAQSGEVRRPSWRQQQSPCASRVQSGRAPESGTISDAELIIEQDHKRSLEPSSRDENNRTHPMRRQRNFLDDNNADLNEMLAHDGDSSCRQTRSTRGVIRKLRPLLEGSVRTGEEETDHLTEYLTSDDSPDPSDSPPGECAQPSGQQEELLGVQTRASKRRRLQQLMREQQQPDPGRQSSLGTSSCGSHSSVDEMEDEGESGPQTPMQCEPV